MKLAGFAYYRPDRVEDAAALLAELGDDARVLAGGQSLLPMMAFRLAAPEHLIDINAIPGLDTVERVDGMLRVGAGVRHQRFEEAAAHGPLGSLLSQVMRNIAHLPIRTRGTFCGSLAHADPASEWCAVTAALDGIVMARSRDGGIRSIPADDFFFSAMETTLEPEELIVSVDLPLLDEACAVGFDEFAFRAGDFAVAMAVAVLRMEDGRIADARLGIGGAEVRPRRLSNAEDILCGEESGTALFAEAAETAARTIDPMVGGDIDAEYRRDVVRAVVRRALEGAAQ